MSVETDYAALADVKTTMGISVTTWDDFISASITAASRAIDGICDRRFYLDADDTSVRYYTPEHWTRLEIDDLNALASLETDSTGDGTFDQTWTLHTDFELEPLNAQADPNEVWPYTRIRVRPFSALYFNTLYPRSVQLTGQFGWAAIPAGVTEGCTMLTERLWKIKESAPLGVLAFQDFAVKIARTDPNILTVLGRYDRHAVAVA